MSFRKTLPVIAFALLLLGAERFARAETIEISANQILYSGVQENASGAIFLAGKDLYPDPTFGSLSPSEAHTAISGGPVCDPANAPYSSNLRESSYLLQNGVLYGASISGTAYGKATCSGVLPGDSVILNGIAFVATAFDASKNQFEVGASDAETAAHLRAAINASDAPGIAGNYQAAEDLNGDNVVWIESESPGSVGNSTWLASSSDERLAVTAFGHGADGATPASPHWWLARDIALETPLRAGEKVRFQFDIAGVDAVPLVGAASYLTIHFSGDDDESVHYEFFSLADERATSQEYAPLYDSGIATVGIGIINYAGSWSIANPHLYESAPKAYGSVGEMTIPVNLSVAAEPPPGDPTTGLGASVRRVGFLTGGANKSSNLNGLQPGDLAIVDIGDLSGISFDESYLISLAQSQKLEIYGYVALGCDANGEGVLPFSQAQLNDFLDRIGSLGLDGVFFDISSDGPPWPDGYGVSRYRQVWAVNQSHARGLKVMFNDADTTLDNAVIMGDANPDEGVQHGINDGTPIPWWPGDGILAESFGLSSEGTTQDWLDFQTTGLRMLKAKESLGIKTYGLFYQLPTRTALTQAYEERYAFYSSVLYGLDGYSLLNPYADDDDYDRPSAYVGSAWKDELPSVDSGGNRISRRTDAGVVQILRDPTADDASDSARDGAAHGDQPLVSVSGMTVAEALNGGSIAWSVSSSEDGANYGPETPLTDDGGSITGFPDPLPNYAKLRAVFSTPTPSKSPFLTPPLALSVSYPAGAYARLYGSALASSSRSATSVTLSYARQGENPLYVEGVVREPAKDTVTLPLDGAKNWEIYLPAATSGTTYKITVKTSRKSSTKTVTLTANGETPF